VLPVLDGLDEFAPARAARAIGALSRALRGGDPIILTCREQEYSDAVHDAGRTIGSTAVINAEALTTEIVLEHLRRSVPPTAVARWRPLLDHLAAHPSGVPASALDTPLMVSLLRSAYDGPGSDPSELLDTERFDTAGSIENHLLDAVIPTAFDDGPAYSDPQRPPVRRWSAAEAESWLTFLTTTMSTMHTQDLAWWQLPREHTTVERSLGNGLIAALWWSLAVLISGITVCARLRSTITLAVSTCVQVGIENDLPPEDDNGRDLHGGNADQNGTTTEHPEYDDCGERRHTERRQIYDQLDPLPRYPVHVSSVHPFPLEQRLTVTCDRNQLGRELLANITTNSGNLLVID
jgi:hypothetical protein